MEENIFFQVSVILGITIFIAFIIRLLRQPLLVAYIVAGIFCGPLFFNLINGSEKIFDSMAQFGVALLLFMIGLSLNLNHLKKIGKISFVAGIGQVLFTFIFGFFILSLIGFEKISATYLAIAITFSSTIIITKLLSDKKDTERIYGRYTIGLMIVQDLIAIAIMIFLGFSGKENEGAEILLPLLAKAFFLIFFLIGLSKYLLPIIMNRVAQSSEFLFIFTVSWCFGIASFVHWLGFSVEIGAIAAGITLGSSPFQMEIASRIKPLRDFFIILFFVILGSEMVVSDMRSILIPGIVLSLFILIGNPLILYLIFRFFKFTRRNSFLAGLTAAQVSEFGFVLLFTASQLGHVNSYEFSVFTVVAITTIFISSYLITYNNQIYGFLSPIFHLFGKDKNHQKDERAEIFDVWIFGCHRVGKKICEILQKKKIKFATVDLNPKTIAKLREKNIPAFFGDASDVEFLETLPLNKSRLVILTAPDPEDQKTLLSFISRFRPKPIFISNLHHYKQLEDIYQLGADYVVLPHFLGGKWLAEFLEKNLFDKKILKNLKKEQLKEMRSDF